MRTLDVLWMWLGGQPAGGVPLQVGVGSLFWALHVSEKEPHLPHVGHGPLP